MLSSITFIILSLYCRQCKIDIDFFIIRYYTISIKLFLNYAIRKKEFEFTASEIVSALNLMIEPSAFGRLLSNHLDVLEKEGLYITDARKSDKRRKHALYEEPIFENE